MRTIPCTLISVTLAVCLFACQSSEQYRVRANALEKEGRYEEAVRLLDEAVEKDPENIKALLDRGADHAALKHYDSAVADYSRVVSLDPKNILAFVNRGKNKARQENHAAAITDFNSAIRIKGGETEWKDRPVNPVIDNGFEYDVKMEEIRFERGIAYFHVDSLQRAFQDFNFSLERKYSVPECYFWRGFIYLSYGKNELGCADLKKAAALGDKDAVEELKSNCP